MAMPEQFKLILDSSLLLMLTVMAEVTCGFYPTLTGDRALYKLWFEQTDTRMHPENMWMEHMAMC